MPESMLPPSEYQSAYDVPLVPLTSEITQVIPRFRILLVGRAGVGKSSLVNSVFNAPLAEVDDFQAGAASIEREITSEHNDYFVIHDSEGYEPGDARKLAPLRNFVDDRCRRLNNAEKLHAIWLCIATPYAGGRIFETGDEEICNLKQMGVPVIVVFTKYDLLITKARAELMKTGFGNGEALVKKTHEMAKRDFENICTPSLRQLARNVPGRIPYVCVSTKHPETLHKLVKITLKNIGIPKAPQERSSFMRRISRSPSGPDEDWTLPQNQDFDDPRTVTLATAQRVDIDSKIATSISIGKRKYWTGLTSGIHFRSKTLWRCLEVVHTDIVRVWNIRGLNQYFESNGFRNAMVIIVNDLSQHEQQQNRDRRNSRNSARIQATHATLADLLSQAAGTAIAAGPAAVLIAPIAATVAVAAWVYGIYTGAPDIVRIMMGYIVDLTVIMQAVFRLSVQDDGSIDTARVEQVIENFTNLQIKERIHAEIRTFVQGMRTPFARDSIIHKIESLIYDNSDISL